MRPAMQTFAVLALFTLCAAAPAGAQVFFSHDAPGIGLPFTAVATAPDPGDIFATRMVAPVLQQLESALTQDISVNDCFKPVSKYWDRINRPEQLITSLPELMRILISPAETGAVTLSVPQDVQAEAFDFPVELFQKRIWRIGRQRPDLDLRHRGPDHPARRGRARRGGHVPDPRRRSGRRPVPDGGRPPPQVIPKAWISRSRDGGSGPGRTQKGSG